MRKEVQFLAQIWRGYFLLIYSKKITNISSLEYDVLQFKFETMTANISPFIEKLQQILNDPANSEIIVFSESNSKLQILSKKKLENILPKYFRHNKFESFVRQLNWYGFYKINNKSVNSYSHPDLEKGIKLSDIKSRRKNIVWKRHSEKKNEEPAIQLRDSAIQQENFNQNLAILVPVSNRMIYNPVSMENRFVQMDPNRNFMFGTVSQPYQMFFSFGMNPMAVPFL